MEPYQVAILVFLVVGALWCALMWYAQYDEAKRQGRKDYFLGRKKNKD